MPLAAAEPKESRWWQCAIGVVAVVLGALLASLTALKLAIDADGVAPEDYDAGNRFAIFSGLLLTCAATVTLGLVGFAIVWVTRRNPRRALVSTMVGFTPALLAIALVPWLWNR